MRTSEWCLVLAVASVVVGTGQAQIVQDMTPERIREAIALGTNAKELRPYKIQEKARWSWPPLISVYTTPFLRVALAANAAKKRYKRFTEVDVTPDMTALEIHVYAASQSITVTCWPNQRTRSSSRISPPCSRSTGRSRSGRRSNQGAAGDGQNRSAPERPSR